MHSSYGQTADPFPPPRDSYSGGPSLRASRRASHVSASAAAAAAAADPLDPIDADPTPFPFSASGVGRPGPPPHTHDSRDDDMDGSAIDVDGWRVESWSREAPPASLNWDASRPFSFARRTGRLDWATLLRVDLEQVVRSRDLALLQRLLHGLVFSDIPQCDVSYLEAGGRGGGSGAANALHLFRLCQLEAEALLHVQAFLLRALQAKEGAVARERHKYAARLEEERIAARALKARLGSAQKELKQARAVIAGYERAAAASGSAHRSAHPVYLPPSHPNSSSLSGVSPHAHYPGEVYTCALCGNAFSAPHFLAAHYQRRHPTFVPERPYQPPSKPRAEEKEPAPYQPPPPPPTGSVDAQALASLRAELTAALDAQWAARRAEDQRRLLARLSTLERTLGAQFSAVPIPAEMAEGQSRLYHALLDEIEAIKAELARDAHGDGGERGRSATYGGGEPRWNIVQAQQPHPVKAEPPAPQPAPISAPAAVSVPASPAHIPASPLHRPPSVVVASPARTPLPSLPRTLDVGVAEPPRPAPLALSSPVDPNPPFSPSPLPVPAPAPAPEQPATVLSPSSLAQLERLRQALLRHSSLSSSGQVPYAPFADLPWLHSRCAAGDWAVLPPPPIQLADVAARVEYFAAPENAHLLAQLEAEMHAMVDAARSYNDIHATVESRAAARPLDPALLAADEVLDRRLEFLPIWEQMLLERERRDAERAAEAAAAEARVAAARAAQEAALEHAIAVQRERQAEARAEAQRAEAKALEQERTVQEQRRSMMQQELARSHSVHALQQQGVSSLDTTSTPHPQQPPGSTWAPYGSTNIGGGPAHSPHPAQPESSPLPAPSPSPSPSRSPNAHNYSGRNIMAHSADGVPSAALSAYPHPGPGPGPFPDMFSPVSVVRPEGAGWGPMASPTPQQQHTIMPRTPARSVAASPVGGAKTPLSVFHPAAARAQLGPSPSASLSSTNGGGAGYGFGFGSGASYGGASIMRSPGPGGLDHISEGSSMNESASVMAHLRVGGAGGGGGGGAGGPSRRSSVEQEGKYTESMPASPAPAPGPTIPRTEVDEEFEQLLSPKRVAPRTQMPLIIAAPPSPAVGHSFMNPSPAQSFSATGSGAHQPAHAPLPSDRSSTQPGSAFAFGHAALTPGPGAATPGPGAAPAPHQYSIGGHGFTFGQRAGGGGGIAEGVESEALEESDEFPMSDEARQWQRDAQAQAAAEEERRRADTERARREEEEEFGVPSSFGRQTTTTQATQQQKQQQQQAQSRGHFDDSLQLDETIQLDDGGSGRGPTRSTVAVSREQEPPSLQPSVSRTLSPSNEQLRNEHAGQQQAQSRHFLSVDPASSGPAPTTRTGELTPAVHSSMHPTPSPVSMLSQPGYGPGATTNGANQNGDPTSPAYAYAGARGAEAGASAPVGARGGDKVTAFGSDSVAAPTHPSESSFGQMEVQSFHASPSASFAQSMAHNHPAVTMQPFASSNSPPQPEEPADAVAHAAPSTTLLASHAGHGIDAVQSFHASSSASVQQQQPRTFLSDFGDDDEFPPDEFDYPASSGGGAAAQPVAAATTALPRRSGVVGPLHSDDSADEEASSGAASDDDVIAGMGGAGGFGRAQPQGVGVIAPGSVSNARAKLLGAGFFPMGSPSASDAPNLSALKAAKAARDREAGTAGADDVDDLMAVDFDSSDVAPLASPLSARPKPAAAGARRARTLPQFSPK